MLSSLKGYMIAAGAVLVLALIVGAYFKGRHDIQLNDSAKFAAIKQQAKDEQAQTDKTDLANNYVKKDAYNELQNKLTGYSTSVDDLTERLRVSAGHPVILPAPVGVTCKSTNPGTIGQAKASDAGPAEPTPASIIQTEILRDDLTLALQNIEALIVVLEEADKVQK